MEPYYIALLLATALGTNAALGVWRSGLRKFSPAWFVAIHASIPLLVAMRLSLVPTTWVIPPEIGRIRGQLPVRGSSRSDANVTPLANATDGAFGAAAPTGAIAAYACRGLERAELAEFARPRSLVGIQG
jgi:hypothetical protein